MSACLECPRVIPNYGCLTGHDLHLVRSNHATPSTPSDTTEVGSGTDSVSGSDASAVSAVEDASEGIDVGDSVLKANSANS